MRRQPKGMICPKCRYEQDDNNQECPRCGIIFQKYNARHQTRPAMQTPPRVIQDQSDPEDSEGILSIINQLLFYVPDEVNAIAFWGRTFLLAGLFAWGWVFILTPVASNAAGSSFMHLVNLPFHEAGHLVFKPFGRIMHSLGGTLGQILMPLICMTVLVVKTRDTFGGAVGLWWAGQNFIDIAPYINDARSLSLPLLGGNTGRTSPYGFHDWEFILKELHLIRYDHFIAGLSHKTGAAVMLLASAWGLYILLKQYRRLRGVS